MPHGGRRPRFLYAHGGHRRRFLYAPSSSQANSSLCPMEAAGRQLFRSVQGPPQEQGKIRPDGRIFACERKKCFIKRKAIQGYQQINMKAHPQKFRYRRHLLGVFSCFPKRRLLALIWTLPQPEQKKNLNLAAALACNLDFEVEIPKWQSQLGREGIPLTFIHFPKTYSHPFKSTMFFWESWQRFGDPRRISFHFDCLFFSIWNNFRRKWNFWHLFLLFCYWPSSGSRFAR